jgi:hypothetical protein
MRELGHKAFDTVRARVVSSTRRPLPVASVSFLSGMFIALSV